MMNRRTEVPFVIVASFIVCALTANHPPRHSTYHPEPNYLQYLEADEKFLDTELKRISVTCKASSMEKHDIHTPLDR